MRKKKLIKYDVKGYRELNGPIIGIEHDSAGRIYESRSGEWEASKRTNDTAAPALSS